MNENKIIDGKIVSSQIRQKIKILGDTNQELSFLEVQVWVNGSNVALNGTATLSSTYYHEKKQGSNWIPVAVVILHNQPFLAEDTKDVLRFTNH